MSSFQEQYKDYKDDVPWHIAKNVLNNACLFHWIMIMEPKSVLEVGAGSGKSAVVIKRLLPEAKVVATDINPTICGNIREFARIAKTEIIVDCQDILSLNYPAQSFDVCYSVGLIEHFSVDNMKKAVKEHLRVGKLVLIEVPLVHWFLRGLSTQGDEIMWPKVRWIREFFKMGHILEVNLFDSVSEETTMLVTMTINKSVNLRIGPKTIISM